MSSYRGITASVAYDVSRMTDQVAASVSHDLAIAINRKLLGEVCENLFDTADVELVRDIFEAVRLDPKIQDRVVAIRAARRIGVK
jgi:hypothetical protein